MPASDSIKVGPAVLKFLNLSDPYERKARFFPAVLTGLVLVPLLAMLGVVIEKWWVAVPGGLLVLSAVVVGVSHLASAFGNRFQAKLYPRWPHDSLSHQWLHPANNECSKQQKERWHESVKKLTTLDILSVSGDPAEVERVINDANRQLRNRFKGAKEAERLDMHNRDYGFARNLAGLRPVWLLFAVVSCAGCWRLYVVNPNESPALPVVSTVLLCICAVAAVVLPGYVLVTARHYADTFFATLEAVAKSVRQPSKRSGSRSDGSDNQKPVDGTEGT